MDWIHHDAETAFDITMQMHYHENVALMETAMPSPLILQSSLTDRYQTTVPAPVRKALGLGKRSKLRFELMPDGSVVLGRAEAEGGEDPVLAKFLGFLAADLERHPGRIRAVSPEWAGRMRALVKGVEVDLNAGLDPEDK
jgi:antitoxin PrlF